MGGSTTTTVQQAAPSPEEDAYLQSQQALAAKQLDIITSQQDFNQSYMDQLKPVLDAQLQLTQQQLAQASDPATQAYNQALQQYQMQNLQDAADLAPLQKQVLEAQLQQTLNGNAATPEQSAQIDAATQAAMDAGKQQIQSFSDDALTQLRRDLSPTLGLRPTDQPIVDRGAAIQKAATNQYGQLVSNLQSANAQAKLDYPLAAAGVTQAGSNFAASLDNAAQQFQASLSDAATQNRLRLLSSAQDAISGGTNQGIGLVTGSRENPLSFSRGSTTTQSTTPGITSILGGLGALGQGLGAIGLSDARAKEDVQTVGHDQAGHRWVRFQYKGDPARRQHVGVIAQEVERTDPEAVLTDGRGVKYVDYRRLRRSA